MKPTTLALLSLLLLSGCDQAKRWSGISDVDTRTSALETQVASLELRLRNTGQWILWQRFQKNSGIGYAPPQAVGAFTTKDDCARAASGNIAPGGTTASQEPLEVVYSYGVQYFYCLPEGVQAGIQQ